MEETLEKEELKGEILPNVYIDACHMKRKLVMMRISPVFCRCFLNFVSLTGLSNFYPPYYILKMVLVNVMVVFESKGSVLLTWEIMGMHNPEESFQSPFETRIKPKISAKLSQEDAENVTVEECYVGHMKNSLDVTDPSLLVQEVISSLVTTSSLK